MLHRYRHCDEYRGPMPTELRTVDLNSGRLQKLVVILNDNNKLVYELRGTKVTSSRPDDPFVIPLSEAEVDLILRIAAFR